MSKYDMNNLPKELFELAPMGENFHDKRFETKPIGYFKDALIRFSKNKASIVAAVIVLLLVLFAIIGPYCFDKNYTSSYETDKEIKNYQYLTPKLSFMEGTGIWDGTEVVEVNEATYYRYMAMAIETGQNPIVELISTSTSTIGSKTSRLYKIRLDRYASISCFTKTMDLNTYLKIQQYQNEHDVQIILPWVDHYDSKSEYSLISNSDVKYKDLNVWYVCNEKGMPCTVTTKEVSGQIKKTYTPITDISQIKAYYRNKTAVSLSDNYDSKRIEGDDGSYAYASVSGSKGNYSYTVRINAYEYFVYKYGFEPAFVFGADANGRDVFTRLASGARFSFLFAIAISLINMVIGAIYGAVEGYYGGVADIVMERISDLLSSIPMMVVTVLFNLHFSGKVGVVPALLLAFVLTGWIGMASRTRMQFYRFKNQEYVLAARTLGASDWRIMFKHIFPNSLGTLITGSVLAIPGVIFSETSLTYLGIVNLDSATRSSVGAMLNAGKGVMTSYPHLVFFPALFIGLLMVCFNLFGNGLRDAFNPSLRGAEE